MIGASKTVRFIEMSTFLVKNILLVQKQLYIMPALERYTYIWWKFLMSAFEIISIILAGFYNIFIQTKRTKRQKMF